MNDTDGPAPAGVSSQTGLTAVNVLLSSARLLVGIFIIVVNSVTIFTFATVERLRTRGNMLVVSLAVTDLMVGVIMPLDVLNWVPGFSQQVQTSEAWCLLRLCWLNICCVASFLNINAIAADRYLYIVHPFLYERVVDSSKMAVVIAMTWVLATVWGTVVLYDNKFAEVQLCDPIEPFSEVSNENFFSVISCVHVHSGLPKFSCVTLSEAFSEGYAVYGATAILVTSFTITAILYTLIFRLALSKLRRVVPGMPTSSSNNIFLQQLQVAKQSLAVFLVFAACWSPHYVIYIVHLISPQPFRTRALVTTLGFLNSALNFFIYVIFNRDFRSKVKLWVRRVCHSRADAVAMRGGHSISSLETQRTVETLPTGQSTLY